VHWNGLSIPIHIRKHDEYAQIVLQDRVKFSRISRRIIRGKVKYVLQLIVEGTPPQKRNKQNGEVRDPIGTGKVGLDIGTQTMAICSQTEVKLLELAPNIDRIDQEKRKMQRKLERQRRANNPHKYHEDGTINRGNRERWVYSKRSNQTRQKLMEMERKVRVKRKQAHEQLANHILTLGDEIKVEQMSFQGLAKRMKETKVDERTGKFKSKKRFGKSIGNKAPALLLGIIERKLSYQGKQLHKVDTVKLKASQYNHVDDHYRKKKLNERWTDIGESRIQRDLYSAFLIMNAKDNNQEVDRDACERGFPRFKKLHNKEIERLSKTKTVASMGII
jgi:transposase